MITHLSKKNKPQIIDISKKEITKRTATAQGSIIFSKKTFKKLEKMQTKKGEITNVAILAGIMGAKKTSELIPLCHNIDITNVDIKITTNKKLSNLVINASVKSTSKTGVEMEALTAVSISCLTIYDMCKSLDKNIIIDKIKLISKKGGKSDYLND
ncbi:MAG: Cyclic pyranopterin monophosphate synthase accessory protein [Alphaproteobacteria bacterium MarineAlpha5_Bin2]|jgi:cyclic pyranopterin phosphate synthase|nr:cyclic pyranopterin monophosphate synthase MoaC [Alphaproteobacteria bacterium]MCH2544135.1 cyclic pyranopterin monophosphate synthase MoaC [Alphaproteobacteria bacterium]PPR54871.1 MAG: Cyclic pyranopterin monophosphate synthase accessory protein [Alphaproteobacteria bacterium MarineAlpha5_Bin2]PPR55301.1 MAG: Cyclic pyranopterin monophosphate synthase accessory protein [Alphaproteobacteria bacterium MarineAlpha5_Bin1]PPR57319.1 MAG: Cyclic pyranopterin monophosphate synthase accessory prot|tara:strand:- start:3208 stop:3675 length:468 start_codon:yes stop_codon:yes gene_type:complete